jgi:hypothetical protein
MGGAITGKCAALCTHSEREGCQTLLQLAKTVAPVEGNMRGVVCMRLFQLPSLSGIARFVRPANFFGQCEIRTVCKVCEVNFASAAAIMVSQGLHCLQSL